MYEDLERNDREPPGWLGLLLLVIYLPLMTALSWNVGRHKSEP